MLVGAGSTNVTTYFDLRLAADDLAATGLTITDFDLQYTRSGVVPSTKVDATALAATDSAHADNKAIEIDATDQPGLYRVDWPDAAFATGVREVILTVKVATVKTKHLRVELGVAGQVWDEVLTGATHNITNSAGRRLRQMQEAGSYSDGHVFIDTVNGNAGTTNFENGVDINPVNSIADANTIAASVGLSRFNITPGSSLTLAATQADQEFEGDNWDLALGGQSVSGSHFVGADVSGIGTGASELHFEHCEIGDVTLPGAHFDDCDVSGTIILSAAGTYIFINCAHGGATPIIDFGAAVGNTTVHIHGWMGALTIKNLGQNGTDVLHFDSAGGKLTLDSTCVGGTIHINGTFDFVNNGSGVTINRGGDVVNEVATVKAKTDQLVFTKANEVDANTKSINDAEIIGDGNATPFDGA